MIDYLKFFPAGYKANTQQDFILTEIAKAKSKGLKYVVVNAATGSGKSFLSKTLANSAPDVSETFKGYVDSGLIYELDSESSDDITQEGTAILTMTKTLQDQYYELFDDGSVLKGKSNYPCSMVPELACDVAPCIFSSDQKELCLACGQCEYYSQRDETVKSKCSFYSYSMFLSLPYACQFKKYLICDEAAELEDILVDSYTIPLNFNLLKKLEINFVPTPTQGAPYEQYVLWLRGLKGEIYCRLSDFKLTMRKKNPKKIKPEEKIVFRALNILNDSCDKIIEEMKTTEFIVEHTKEALVFKPYKISNLAQKMFRNSNFVVLMSATIIDHRNFTKQLGIKPEEYVYIEAPSTFDPKKAPIKLSNKICVTYKNKAETIPQLAKIASQICKLHGDKKGIIHTHSNEITSELKKVLGINGRFLYREKGVTNENIIEKHFESDKPTVLVSPSMSRGIDLKGNLGEFAIIMKAPFLPLSDLRIKRLCAEDSEWYGDKMLGSLIQQVGRTIRSKNDTSITYILDGTLTNKLLAMKDKIPKYIFERFC